MKRIPFLFSAWLVTALVWLAPAAAPAQSLWREGATKSMFADKRDVTVGGILTILVQENNATTKENSTKTARKSGMDASISSFLYSPGASSFLTKNGKMPAMKMDAANSFDGGGQINNAEKITARIAVKIVEVLPNGHLVIEGKRKTSFSGESMDAVLRGTVRSEDVAGNNTVFSYNIADASIQYLSKGTVSDSQRKGWFTKVWDKVAPF